MQPKLTPKLPPKPPLHGTTIQRMLERNPFSSGTQKAVLLTKGQHRRHIIPNHLMKQALQAWLNAHPGVIDVDDMQDLLDRMNDYVPNLHPGEGVQNSAQGMIGTWGERKLSHIGGGFSSSDVGGLFDKPSGFFQQHQQNMLAPMRTVFGSDDFISQNPQSAFSFGMNIVDSVDFDWPGGTPQEYENWRDAYNAFLSLKNNAASYDQGGLETVCEGFLSLAAPSGRHDR